MKLTLYVANSASTSSRPEDAVNILRLHLPPKGDKIDDQNNESFPDQNKKSALIEVHGLSDEIQAQFKGGKRVTVTLDVE